MLSSPGINDITTDANVPPPIAAAATARGFGANAVDYPGERYSLAQGASYPEIMPIITNRSPSEVFDLAHDVVEKRGWEILAERAPPGRGSSGTIEAVDYSFVFGFPDDVVLRISGSDGKARVDVRSASRYGGHDLGRNAQRVKELIKELQARIDASVRIADRESEAAEAEAEKIANEAAVAATAVKKSDFQARVNRRKKRDRARSDARGGQVRKAKQRPKSADFPFDIAPQR